jgi:uncharacterized protein
MIFLVPSSQSPTMENSRSGLFLVTASLVVGGAFIVGKNIESQPRIQPSISVQGEGKVQAIPDIALLNFGVQTGRSASAQAAMETLARKMNAIIAAVEASGIEKKDITTQSLWLNPAYDYLEGRRVDKGFEANQNLSVKVRNLEHISAVLDVAVQQGANQVGGVSFTIDDMRELRREAREKAIADAKQKALVLAEDLGVTLGKFQGYGEGGAYYPQPAMMRMESVGMGGGMDTASPELPSGEQEISISVSLTYEVR